MSDKLDPEHENLRQEIRIILIQMDSNFDVMNERLEAILEQTKKTNGRVTSLESVTEVLRIVFKYKWLFALIVIGVYNLINLIDIEKWIKLIF